MRALIGLFGSACNQNIQRDMVKVNRLGDSWEVISIMLRQLGSLHANHPLPRQTGGRVSQGKDHGEHSAKAMSQGDYFKAQVLKPVDMETGRP